jgi:hypothetical protein
MHLVLKCCLQSSISCEISSCPSQTNADLDQTHALCPTDAGRAKLVVFVTLPVGERLILPMRAVVSRPRWPSFERYCSIGVSCPDSPFRGTPSTSDCRTGCSRASGYREIFSGLTMAAACSTTYIFLYVITQSRCLSTVPGTTDALTTLLRLCAIREAVNLSRLVGMRTAQAGSIMSWLKVKLACACSLQNIVKGPCPTSVPISTLPSCKIISVFPATFSHTTRTCLQCIPAHADPYLLLCRSRLPYTQKT